MKKNISILLLMVLFVSSFCSCERQTILKNIINNISDDTVFLDNETSLNTISSVCIYGNYQIALQHNDDGTDSVISIDKKLKNKKIIYKHFGAIQGIKPINKASLCLISDNVNSYYCLDLISEKAEKVKIDLPTKNNVLQITPYFLENASYVVALVAIEGEYEPSYSIFKKNNDDYTLTAENCSQFQFNNNGVYFNKNGVIYYAEYNSEPINCGSYELDRGFSVMSDDYVVFAKNGSYEIMDIKTSNIIFTADNIVDKNSGVYSAVKIIKNRLFYVNEYGINVFDGKSMKSEEICKIKPTDFIVYSDYIFFEYDNVIFRINEKNHRIETVC